jgi:hypothetical protein
MGEARVRTFALPLDRRRFPEQPGAPEEREEDDRGPVGSPRDRRLLRDAWFHPLVRQCRKGR